MCDEINILASRHFGHRSAFFIMLQVVGLGNFDRINSRHSVGMKVIDRLAFYLNMEWAPNRHLKALTASKVLTVQSDSQPLNFRCHLLKSKLPMNANGASVRRAGSVFVTHLTFFCLFMHTFTYVHFLLF